ncbi:MAG TPA: hypothetical protein VFI29_17475 [Hanamia sp.]|nr:hypothetical protein [Hanamia sp.]
MRNNFFAYIQQLELMAFFSGYCLLYAIILVFAGNKEQRNNFKSRVVSVLPLSYALVGTLFLGLQLKNLYLSYSYGNIRLSIHHPYLMIWGLLSILFWIPPFRKKKELSLLHSLVFFFIVVKDIFMQIGSSVDENILKNDMRTFTVSFLLNLAAFILIALLYFFSYRIKKRLINR